tara:strand:+ start:279 stop:563 length:285 start_codon:yes stop_codon:yes gene_type:complete
MRFYKCAAYVLFAISLCNLGFSAYMYRELRTPNVIVAPDPALREIKEHSIMRDTQLLQGILMIHHDRNMHKPGDQMLCPLCDQFRQNSKLVNNE